VKDGPPQPDPLRVDHRLRRAPAIRKADGDDGPCSSACSMSRPGPRSPRDFPGERLIACRNPVLAADRARTRTELLAATGENCWRPDHRPVGAGRFSPRRAHRVEAGKVISRYKTGKHFAVHHHRHHPGRAAPAGPDRRRSRPWTGSTCSAPPVPPPNSTRPPWSPPTRTSNTPDGTSGTSIRRPGPAARLPPARRTRQGPRADLHARLLPHLAPAPSLGPADLHRPEPARPGQPRRPRPPLRGRPGQGLRPARPGRAALPQLRGLLDHLATLTATRSVHRHEVTVPMLTEPTSTSGRPFELIGTAIRSP